MSTLNYFPRRYESPYISSVFVKTYGTVLDLKDRYYQANILYTIFVISFIGMFPYSSTNIDQYLVNSVCLGFVNYVALSQKCHDLVILFTF